MLQRLNSTLNEKKVDTSCNFSEEFNENGMLSNIYLEFKKHIHYPTQKLVNMVLVQNCAMQVVEQIYCVD